MNELGRRLREAMAVRKLSGRELSLAAGLNTDEVSRILGHSSVAVTAAVYMMALSADERGYFERLGALLDPGDKPPDRPSGASVPSGEWRHDGEPAD